DSQILHVTNKGVGKRTPEIEYRVTKRGGKGIFTCRLTEETGHVVAVKAVNGDEDIMIITVDGVLIRIPVEGISVTGRNTQGVRLIRRGENEEVATIAKVPVETEEDQDESTDNNTAETENDEPSTELENENQTNDNTMDNE